MKNQDVIHSIPTMCLLQLDVLLHESAGGAETRHAELLLLGLLDAVPPPDLSSYGRMDDAVTTQRAIVDQGVIHTRFTIIISQGFGISPENNRRVEAAYEPYILSEWTSAVQTTLTCDDIPPSHLVT